MKIVKFQPNYKNILLIAGAIAAAVIVYKVVGKKKDNSGSQYDPTGNGNSAPIDAQAIAETLYNAMKVVGTDEAAIKNALKSVSSAQFKQVITAFGNRKYNKTTGTTTKYLFELDEYGLKDWLKSELSTSDYELLRLKYPSDL